MTQEIKQLFSPQFNFEVSGGRWPMHSVGFEVPFRQFEDEITSVSNGFLVVSRSYERQEESLNEYLNRSIGTGIGSQAIVSV